MLCAGNWSATCTMMLAVLMACPVSGLSVDKDNKKTTSAVMIDAGSSGSKLFSLWGGTTETVKVESDCIGVSDRIPMKGVAALAEACTLELAEHGQTHLMKEPQDDLGPALMNRLEYLHLHHTGDPKIKATNKDSVPILATAGMRVVGIRDQDKIWSSICGQTSSSEQYTSAKKNHQCGTIPGTKEAEYEFTAFAHKKKLKGNADIKKAGAVGIGGVSLQIGLVLTLSEKQQFETHVRDHQLEFHNCSQKDLLSNGQSMAYFAEGSSGQDCTKDFFNTVQLTKAHGAECKDEKCFLGLISFLGLGKGRMIAGGANALHQFAHLNGCAAGHIKNWEGCKKALDDALETDPSWQTAMAILKDKQIAPHVFTPITPAGSAFNEDLGYDNCAVGGDGKVSEFISCMQYYFVQTLNKKLQEHHNVGDANNADWAAGVSLLRETSGEDIDISSTEGTPPWVLGALLTLT